jgi:hypothetical protein
LETLIPFWMALKPPIPSDSQLRRILPPDQASPQAWLALDNQWANKWSLGQALNTTDDLLGILREPCGGVDHKDWIARSWDWRFLLPADSSAAQNTDTTSTTTTNTPWNNNGNKRKAKRSKAEDESSNHSQSSHLSSGSNRTSNSRDAPTTPA